MAVQQFFASGLQVTGKRETAAGVKAQDKIAPALFCKKQILAPRLGFATPWAKALHLDHHIGFYGTVKIMRTKQGTVERSAKLGDRRSSIWIARRCFWQAAGIEGHPPLKNGIGSVRLRRSQISIRNTPRHTAERLRIGCCPQCDTKCDAPSQSADKGPAIECHIPYKCLLNSSTTRA